MKFALSSDLTSVELFHLAAFGIPKNFRDSVSMESSIHEPMFVKAYVKISKEIPEIVSSTTTYGSSMLITSTKPQKIAQNIWENILAGDLKALANVINFSEIGHCSNSYAPKIYFGDSWRHFVELFALHGAVIVDNNPLVRESDPQKLNSLAVSLAAKIGFIYGMKSIIHMEDVQESSYMEILTHA